ncbi:MarR family winged helix-turn-helix transcriptional regulator [Frankia sp. CiP3]|uniref:MarR family winged helix-turn-helix transcriptional regulator n=1 Tax=Frankia sp. CiP3 TaxID=2880971 RepID=UPI00272EE221|nr:MarR family transcriptional regulator [Frankia sp. CiP3]
MTSQDIDMVGHTEDGRRDSSLRLDDQLCFALYAASRAMTGVYRPVLDQLGLTYPQYLVMLVLWEHEASPVKELCAALQLDYGTLSPLLKRLESTGLLRRERRVDDERSVQITLTEEGAALRERARSVPSVIERAMGLSSDEFVALRSALHRLTAVLTATAELR